MPDPPLARRAPVRPDPPRAVLPRHAPRDRRGGVRQPGARGRGPTMTEFTHIDAPEMDSQHGIKVSLGRCARCGRAITPKDPDDPGLTATERLFVARPTPSTEQEPVND